MRYLFLFAMLLMSCGNAQAANPVTVLDITEQHGAITVHFSLSGQTVTADEAGQPQVSPVDRLQARLTVESPETLSVTLPTFSGATFGDFTLIDQGKISRSRTNQITTTTSWIIGPYNPGEYGLPPLTIIAAGPNKTNQNITLNLPALQVRPLAAEPDFDLLPPRRIKENSWRILLISLGVIAAVLLLVFCLRGKKRPRPLSPKQQALRQLDQLEGNCKEKMAALSIITRQFLDNNFHLCTMKKTYEEYEPFIRKHPQIQRNTLLLEILHHCDQSNYSGTPATDDDIAQLTQHIHDFIENCAEPLRLDEETTTCGRW